MVSEVNGEIGDISAVGSYTVNGKFYCSNETFRPYIGAGIGLYSLAAVSFEDELGSSSGMKLGFYPRIGFDLGHFNINIDYNIVGTTEYTGIDADFNEVTSDVKNSYIGIRCGAFVFGGRK